MRFGVEVSADDRRAIVRDPFKDATGLTPPRHVVERVPVQVRVGESPRLTVVPHNDSLRDAILIDQPE
jgi:hypothetical protein